MADTTSNTTPGSDGDEGGLARAAESFTENLANKVPDGVDEGPSDDADEPADGRTRVHSSISEGLNADDDQPPPVLDEDAPGMGRGTSS